MEFSPILSDTMWARFVNHPDMAEITKRVAWVHVDIPGQEDNAEDLKPEYVLFFSYLPFLSLEQEKRCENLKCNVTKYM